MLNQDLRLENTISSSLLTLNSQLFTLHLYSGLAETRCSRLKSRTVDRLTQNRA